MCWQQVAWNFVISLIASGLAGLIVGLIFERRSTRATERIRRSLLTDFAQVITNEIANLSTGISNQISSLSQRVVEQVTPIASATRGISDGIDALVKYFKEK